MPSLPLVIPADHPAFAGHFPGRPIVPGVVLLDQAQLLVEAAGCRISGLGMAKFLSPVSPGEALWLDHDETGHFTIRAEARKIASGRFCLRDPEAA